MTMTEDEYNDLKNTFQILKDFGYTVYYVSDCAKGTDEPGTDGHVIIE